MNRSHYPHLTNEELVIGALLGSLEAFDELVRRFRGAVRLAAEQVIGSRELAEDAAQEAFLLAFKALPQLDDPSKFGSWLYAITRRRAQKLCEQSRRYETKEANEIDQLLMDCSQELIQYPTEEIIYGDEIERLHQEIAALAPDLKIVVLLYYFEDWSVGQIAEFLSLPKTTIKWRLHQGRATLKKLIEQRLEDECNE